MKNMNIILPRVPDNLNGLKMYAELAGKKNGKKYGIKSLYGNTTGSSLYCTLEEFDYSFNQLLSIIN